MCINSLLQIRGLSQKDNPKWLGKGKLVKNKKMAQLASSQFDKIVSQGKQTQLSADLLQASEHKSAKVSVIFDMSEHAY